MADATPVDTNRDVAARAFYAWNAGPHRSLTCSPPTWCGASKATQLVSREYANAQTFIDEVLAPFGARFAQGERFRPVRVRTIHADGDTVIVVWDGHGVANDGQPYENSYAWIMR